MYRATLRLLILISNPLTVPSLWMEGSQPENTGGLLSGCDLVRSEIWRGTPFRGRCFGPQDRLTYTKELWETAGMDMHSCMHG